MVVLKLFMDDFLEAYTILMMEFGMRGFLDEYFLDEYFLDGFFMR